MGIKKFKPVTPGQRTRSVLDNEVLTRKGPEKSLTESLSSSGGRNHHGRITVRRRGGGHKRKYRIVDFKRNKLDVPAIVKEIEYDPNRSANIALVFYEDGEKRYILHPKGLNVGDTIMSGPASARSSRYDRAQHRAQAGQGRSASAFCRGFGPGRGEGGRLRDVATSFDRNAPVPQGVHGDHRRGR